MPCQSQIDYRNRQLFLACRNLMDKQFQGDSEAVKEYRDGYISQNFEGRNYRELSYEEMNYAISELNEMSKGEIFSPQDKKGSITFSQIKIINFYKIGLGLLYTDFSKMEFTVDGEPVTGNQIRESLQIKFNNKEKLPPSVLNYMYKQWINPRCNEWLVEGNFKKYVNNPEVLYYEQLSLNAATYLIKRLSQMWSQVAKRSSEEHVYDYSKN